MRAMGTLLQDVRFGARVLAKNPGLPALAIITLALGIAANGTIFSWINSTLLRPIPGVTETSDMVTIMRGERSEHPTPPFSYLDYRDLRDANRSFSGILAYHHDWVSLTGAGRPERVYGVLTSANYFDVLGVRPILGRDFLPGEEERRESAAVVVISYGLWQGHFGGDISVIGKSVQINLHPYTIIGVAPRRFEGCMPGLRADLWIPLVMAPTVWNWGPIENRGQFWLNALGKLKHGVNQQQARAELDLLMQRIVDRFPDDHRGPNQITLDPLWRSPFGANIYLSKSLPILLALAVALLLLACANVANLLLVRYIARRREVAIRLSMGASRWQLVRQLMVESLLLALAAGALAALTTIWTASSFAAFLSSSPIPLAFNSTVDTTVTLATFGIAACTALIFGILPALRSCNVSPITVLKEEAGSVSSGLRKLRLASAMVVVQIALSLLLLICAGLFTRSLEKAEQSDPGFDANHVLIASYELGPSGYSEDRELEFDRQLLAKLAGLPGVESVTMADFSPLNFTIRSDDFQIEGYLPKLHESMQLDRANVGPNYFRAMRTPLISGRDFTLEDNKNSQPVAIVNQEFVHRYWPGQDALGKRIEQYGQWATVVGVAQNAKYRLLVYGAAPCVFLPALQHRPDPMILHIRVAGDPRAFAPAVEKAVEELNPNLPVFGVTTLKTSMKLGSVFQRVGATFASSLGLLALALAAVGLYGVVSYATRQRTHEIGIRIALGAKRSDILRIVMAQGLGMTLVGLGVGLVVSLGATRALRAALFGVTSTDLVTYLAVAVLLGLITLIACYIPARRATKVEPVAALRCE
jgi:predicted permease